MKIRWREHEMIFVTLLVIIQVIIYLKQLYEASVGITVVSYAKEFEEAGGKFIYWKQVFAPQLLEVLLLFAAYLAINLVILPLIKKISFNDVERIFSKNILYPCVPGIPVCNFLGLSIQGGRFFSAGAGA